MISCCHLTHAVMCVCVCVCVQDDAANAKQSGKLLSTDFPPIAIFWHEHRPQQTPINKASFPSKYSYVPKAKIQTAESMVPAPQVKSNLDSRVTHGNPFEHRGQKVMSSEKKMVGEIQEVEEENVPKAKIQTAESMVPAPQVKSISDTFVTHGNPFEHRVQKVMSSEKKMVGETQRIEENVPKAWSQTTESMVPAPQVKSISDTFVTHENPFEHRVQKVMSSEKKMVGETQKIEENVLKARSQTTESMVPAPQVKSNLDLRVTHGNPFEQRVQKVMSLEKKMVGTAQEEARETQEKTHQLYVEEEKRSIKVNLYAVSIKKIN